MLTSFSFGLLLTLISIPALLAQHDQAYWCAISANHTLCKYPAPRTTCNRVSFGVDGNMRDLILSQHNVLRARVASGGETRGAPGPQPLAANMAKFRWNTDLAEIAQRWADQCIFNTDAVRNASLTSGGPVQYVGQNIYAYLDSAINYRPPSTYPQPSYWQEAINSWYSEVLKFNRNTVASYQYLASVGHYTQLVWANTTDIGCGFTQWTFTNNRIARILVCDYGPGGNRAGTPVYIAVTAGQSACSQCSSCDGPLCAQGSGGTGRTTQSPPGSGSSTTSTTIAPGSADVDPALPNAPSGRLLRS